MKKILESYTVDEVAGALKLHPYTVRRLCREGKIPCFKFGGQWRLRKDEMEKWSKKKEKTK
ncbi:MAG: helix-turn-helix domain-containing protein [Candidatus Omnitrophota bacterium]